MNTNTSIAKGILRDLEEVYRLALEKENFSSALKAKELLGREHGLFGSKLLPKIDPNKLSDEDIEQLIKTIETELKFDSPNDVYKPLHGKSGV